MSTNEFAATIADAVHRVLKPRGYRKVGLYFRADRPDAILIVQLQKSRYSSHDRLEITGNLGVYSRAVAAKLGEIQEKPIIPFCHWRRRIGEYLPQPQDHWWSVSDHTQALRAAQEISELIEKHVVRELEELAPAAKLRELWQSGRGHGLTAKQRQIYLEALG